MGSSAATLRWKRTGSGRSSPGRWRGAPPAHPCRIGTRCRRRPGRSRGRRRHRRAATIGNPRGAWHGEPPRCFPCFSGLPTSPNRGGRKCRTTPPRQLGTERGVSHPRARDPRLTEPLEFLTQTTMWSSSWTATREPRERGGMPSAYLEPRSDLPCRDETEVRVDAHGLGIGLDRLRQVLSKGYRGTYECGCETPPSKPRDRGNAVDAEHIPRRVGDGACHRSAIEPRNHVPHPFVFKGAGCVLPEPPDPPNRVGRFKPLPGRLLELGELVGVRHGFDRQPGGHREVAGQG